MHHPGSGRRIDRRALLTGVGRSAALVGLARVAAGPLGRTLADPPFRLLAADAPRIITRAEWGADESLRRGTPRFHPVRKFVIHHTATANGESDPRRRVRSVYLSHVHRRGDGGGTWDDIGYNFVIDEQGRIYEGRRARPYASGEVHGGEDPFFRGVRGAHAGEWNRGSIGVALIGTYTGRRPTDAAVEALTDLIAWKCARHGLDAGGVQPWTNSDGETRLLPTIVGHRDVRSTACPGDGVLQLLPTIRRRTADKVRSAGGASVVAQATDSPGGYRILHDNGAITSLGDARDVGDLPRRGVQVRAAALAVRRRSSDSFWVVDDVGGVYAFGGARFFGSIPGLRLAGRQIGRAEVMHIASTVSGGGYWVLDRAGGTFAFGDARFVGSIPGLRLAGQQIGEADVIASAPTPSGNGYWILDRAGGVFTFGDARYLGSIPALRNSGRAIGEVDAVDLRPSPSGNGYWVLDATGGVFTFGDARFFGSIPGTGFPTGARARRLLTTSAGDGYLVLTDDGGVLAFGDAAWHGHGPPHASVDLMVA